MNFPAMERNTLGWDDPKLKSSSTGDIIDFYGSCDETPTGSNQAWQQKQHVTFWKK
jgi:hypothetical protein